MPDLGKYADAVLSSYAVSIALLVGLVALSLWQSKRGKAYLAKVEGRQREGGKDAPRSADITTPDAQDA